MSKVGDLAVGLVDRWKVAVFLFWLLFVVILIVSLWPSILLFNLPDADDNMRLMQVRDLLHGQPWYDLRQHRMNPPAGANIHWSRLVDLPIAALLLGLRSFFDDGHAERLAVALAPLLPLLLAMYSLALTVRRLIAPRAYPLAFLVLYFAVGALAMFVPERIDHHGWQLALLALGISALVDQKPVRGAVTLGISSALSLAIGLETILYVAMLAAAVALFWVADAAETKRLRFYALSLGAATAVSYLLFASYDNRHPVCDALSPVWLSDAALGSALLYALTWRAPRDRRIRLSLVAASGAAVALFHSAMWPHCLGNIEGLSPIAERLWLSQIREAWPIYRQDPEFIAVSLGIPIIGLTGWSVLAWTHRNHPRLLRCTIAAAAPAVTATLLMFWQTRTASAAHLLAIPGCVALIWVLMRTVWSAKSDIIALAGALVVLIVGTGAVVPLAFDFVGRSMPSEDDLETSRADQGCLSMWAMHDLDQQPKGLVMTFVDLGPRVITLTRHDVIAGPYHRNQAQIVDVMNFWRGSEEQAHALATKYHPAYVLSCPHSSGANYFSAEAPDGFYEDLQRGLVPKWMAPIELPPSSPFKMWKVTS